MTARSYREDGRVWIRTGEECAEALVAYARRSIASLGSALVEVATHVESEPGGWQATAIAWHRNDASAELEALLLLANECDCLDLRNDDRPSTPEGLVPGFGERYLSAGEAAWLGAALSPRIGSEEDNPGEE